MLIPVVFPPYSKGYAIWKIDFQGQATAILAVPFERERKSGVWSILIGAILPGIQSQNNFLSRILTSAANDWLKNQANQQSSGFRPGDVFSLGDIYVLTGSQFSAVPQNLAPILQDVTFQLVPDIAPPANMGGMGMGQVTLDKAFTNPAPPGGIATPFNLNFNPSSNWTATAKLAKGYSWKATGNITAPMGYQPVNQPIEFQVPGSNTVTIPVKLTVLLQLQVYTTASDGPCSAQVQLINGSGQVVGQQTSASDGKGNYLATFITVQPGSYTIKAAAPYRSPGQTSVNVQIGTSQSETATLGPVTPPPPPGG